MYLYLYVTYCSSVFIVDNDKKCSVYDTVCVPYENINFSILFKNSGFLLSRKFKCYVKKYYASR